MSRKKRVSYRDHDEVMKEQKKLHPLIKSKEPELLVEMIVPGRRALGEDFSRVTISQTSDELVVKREDTEAPADRKPIMVYSSDRRQSEDIIQAQREQAMLRLTRPSWDCSVPRCRHQDSSCKRWQIINAAWHDYVEQKGLHLAGTSQFGPGGFTQRQRVYQNPATRPKWSKD